MSEWVKVTKWLPEDSEDVKKMSDQHFEMCSVIAYGRLKGGCGFVVKETNRFCTHKTGIDYLDRITEIEGREFGKWYWATCWEEVSHWMPIPEPPKD